MQATVCLSVGISCNFMMSDVSYFEKKIFLSILKLCTSIASLHVKIIIVNLKVRNKLDDLE